MGATADTSEPLLGEQLVATSNTVANDKLEVVWKTCVTAMNFNAAKGLLTCDILIEPYIDKLAWNMESEIGKKLLCKFEENRIRVLDMKTRSDATVILYVSWRKASDQVADHSTRTFIPKRTCTCTIV